MRLIVDANILVRCVLGQARRHVAALTGRHVVLAITERQVEESLGIIVGKFKAPRAWAEEQLAIALEPFEIIATDDYADQRDDARRRLRAGAGDDWHCLAASMTLSAPIWSEDIDFFGTGAPVWSTRNLKFIGAADA